MATTMIAGATGSGKTAMLKQRYRDWVQEGVRTDQILVLTAGAAHTSHWRQGIDLVAHGPIEAHSFFGFVQRELNLFWANLQAEVPQLRRWVSPEFLEPAIAHQVMRGLLQPLEVLFGSVVKASPERLAIQIVSNLSTVGSAATLSAGAAAGRLARADQPEKEPLYESAGRLIQIYRERSLEAGLLDYGLALELFTGVLMKHEPYMEHLRNRYRCLLVDDLDESVPAEQDFLEALAGEIEHVVCAINPDGGHARFQGADPVSAMRRFREGALLLNLPGSHTCSPEMFAFGEALAQRVAGEPPPHRFANVVADLIAPELRGEMVSAVAAKVVELVEQGVPPGEIAVIAPFPDNALEVTLRKALSKRSLAIPLHSLMGSRRLVDEPYARTAITLAGLVNPQWKIPMASPGPIAQALQVLLKLDPIRAADLGEAIWQAGGVLPTLEVRGLGRRLDKKQMAAYLRLKDWIAEAKGREWETDSFVQAVIIEVMAPLIGDLSLSQTHACQQLLLTAARFRKALDRFGEGAYGWEYVRLLTEAAAGSEPLDPYDTGDGVTLATPFGYLSRRLASRVQIWVDLSSQGWYPKEVKELFNPHVLSRHWAEGERWSDSLSSRVHRASAARTVRALAHRCTGSLILAQCSFAASGQEQEGELAEAIGDLIVEGRGRL